MGVEAKETAGLIVMKNQRVMSMAENGGGG